MAHPKVLHPVPGITARYATNEESAYRPPTMAPSQAGSPAPPPSEGKVSTACSQIAPSGSGSSKGVASSPGQPKSSVSDQRSETATQPPQSPVEHRDPSVSQAPSESQHSMSTDAQYPHLVRSLVPTYRGRQLREEVQDGVSRYIDDAAVFVGRLSKTQETQLTLFKRFERYGKIVSANAREQS